MFVYFQDKPGRPAENGQLCAMDPKTGMIALQLYEGLIKVVTLEGKSKKTEVPNLRKVLKYNTRVLFSYK